LTSVELALRPLDEYFHRRNGNISLSLAQPFEGFFILLRSRRSHVLPVLSLPTMHLKAFLLYFLSLFTIIWAAIPETPNTFLLERRTPGSAESRFSEPDPKKTLRCYIRPSTNFCTKNCHCTSEGVVACNAVPQGRAQEQVLYTGAFVFGQNGAGTKLKPRTCPSFCACETRKGKLIWQGMDEDYWKKHGLDLQAVEKKLGFFLDRSARSRDP
jgi:hypothetical protein